MRLSDIMSNMQLGFYAEVALVLFLGAFVAIAVSLFWGRRSEEWERCRYLPLDDAEGATAVLRECSELAVALSTSITIGTEKP
ncbi:MAG TPA: hypothetical protein VJU61_03385 [Polyangiaceae bacterium]|nr:hypothetical protein [Polyangiaceae bacterium]